MKIEERRFVVFGEAIIEVDWIIALAGTVLRNGEPAIVVILKNKASVTLAGESMAFLMEWWRVNMHELTEKTTLPEPLEPVETPVEAPADVVVTPRPPIPSPVKTPLTPESIAPSIVSEVASQVAPEPPPPLPVVKAPRLDEIGKI